MCPPGISYASGVQPEEFSRAGRPVISNISIGAYPDKTRIVLDVSGKFDFSYSINRSGTMVIVNLPQVNWQTTRYSRHNLGVVQGYFFDWGKGGVGHLGIPTATAVRIKAAFGLPPDGQHGYRIVLDLEALEELPVADDKTDMVSNEKAALTRDQFDEADVAGLLTKRDREVESRLPQGMLPLFDPDKLSSPAEEGIDEVAFAPRRGAACPAFPHVLWWENNTHEQTINYVNSRYKGDWKAYGAKWEKHLAKVVDVFVERKEAHIVKAGVTLKGGDFIDYIEKIEKRIAVIRCLSRHR
ncbi:MAG: hypothetical protein A3G18_01215 [Rhodospirillales bacterium RIFCSPLOWO2_12_FULL_58_28]|nr:MAG: hypothetical protein A3H92_04415 [Rhodospirillales bacterium RIFCSPLOWO2_02_FULL_58_16]OHC78023.1 MAG: hypothetical protein A3G18_01215 [Rhodospirillales bacterium RIFCSPLOWO2_12_FULL_58_28]